MKSCLALSKRGSGMPLPEMSSSVMNSTRYGSLSWNGPKLSWSYKLPRRSLLGVSSSHNSLSFKYCWMASALQDVCLVFMRGFSTQPAINIIAWSYSPCSFSCNALANTSSQPAALEQDATNPDGLLSVIGRRFSTKSSLAWDVEPSHIFCTHSFLGTLPLSKS